MNSQIETMLKVVEGLKARGIAASLEYPGWIAIDGIAMRSQNFGIANPLWGWDCAPSSPLCGEIGIPSDSTDVDAIVAAIAALIKQYVLVWGAGETEQGREGFETLDAVRGFLEDQTDLNVEQIETLVVPVDEPPYVTKRSDADDDPQVETQFDCAWIRLERTRL